MQKHFNYLTELNHLLEQHFDLEEIWVLIRQIQGTEIVDKGGENQSPPLSNLLEEFNNNGRLPELLALVREKRPEVNWPTIADDYQPAQSEDVRVGGDKVGGDKITVGNISDGAVVAAGAGATAVYQQGLSVKEVAALVVELKEQDQKLVWDGRFPYLGLTAFQESDAEFFFGRESLVADLLERVERAKFIAIAGPSGSGKSSVARAGLLHALRSGRLEKSNTWLFGAMQPRGNPIEQLALAVSRLAGSPVAGNYLRLEAYTNPLALQEQLESLLSDDRQQRCVLLVDQFEETFTQTKDEAERETFINLLIRAAESESSRSIIIISLRSDFVSQCARFPKLRTYMSREFQLVGAMEPRDLAKAITLPAIEVGAEIDPALVSRIIEDMKGEPGALPLMSFALRDLFEAEKTQKGEPMDMMLAEYLNRGGIDSALERHANQVFDNFTAEQQELAQSIFPKLIEVGQGRVDTRRTATFAELVPAGVDANLVTEVVSVLAQEGVRLVTTSGDHDDEVVTEYDGGRSTVTIAHEKLIDAWPWLRDLIDENREIITLQNQINSDAQAWAKGEDAGYLYRGGRLLQVEEKWDLLKPKLNSLSQRFIQTSLKAKEAEQQAEAERIQKEEALRQERANAGRFRRLTIIVTIFSVIAFIVGIVAFLSWNEANEQRGIAENQRANAVIAQETAEAAVAVQEIAVVTAEAAEAEAREAEAVAIESAAEARESESEAIAAQSETESLRLADVAEVFYEEGRTVPALLIGHEALEASQTDEATNVLTRTLTAYLSNDPETGYDWPPNADGLMALACQSAGRNLTVVELSAKFDEPYDEDLLIICDQYGLHLSFAEQEVRECSNLLDALRFFNMAEPPLDENGQALTFNEWSRQIFMNQALINQDKACLDLAGLTDQEAGIFLSIVQQLNTPTGEGDTPEEAYQNVVALDNLKAELPDYAAASLDPLLTKIYGDYCTNLSLKLETAILACQNYNDIRTSDFVAFIPERVADAPTNFRRFTFEGQSDQIATFELSTFGEIDTFSLIVTDPVSKPLQTINRQSNPGVLETYSFLLNDNGTYTFDIQWFQARPPKLALHIELDEPGAITFGERQGAPGDGQWWQFDGNQGDILKLAMNALDSGDPVLRLINSQGFMIWEDDDSGEGNNALFETFLPADDTYYINAGWYEYDSGEYSLLVEMVDSELEYGQTAEGTAVRRYWQFEASQDDLLIITMEAVSDGDPNLTLLDETGAQIGFNDNGPSGLDAEIFAIIPAAGVYYLETGWNNDPARYSITVDEIEPQIIDLTELTTVEVTTVEAASDQRIWQFSAQPGDIVAITMDAVGDNVPFLRLLDASNVELTNNIGNNEDQAATIQWQIWDDKTYYIEAGWIGNPGPYTLSIAQTEPGFLSLGQLETGEPDESWWLIEGDQGEVVEIYLDAEEEESFPQLYIYSDEGVELPYTYVDNPDDAYLAIAFPQNGLYYLRIRWQEMNSPYSILMNRLDSDSDPDETADLLKRSALFLIQRGEIEDGLTLLEPTQNLETSQELIFPEEYSTICRYGSLWGYAEQVITYCETAVNLDSSNGNYRDSYGIALAMLGDYEAAISEFELVILLYGPGLESDLRQEWIEALEAGENPFEDEELLEMLRNE